MAGPVRYKLGWTAACAARERGRPMDEITPSEPSAEQPSPALSVRDERRRNRLRRNLPWIIAAAVVAVIALGIAGYVAYSSATRSQAASDRLAEAQVLVEQADDIVLAVDEVVRSEVTTAVGADASSAATRMPDARDDLERALELIGEATPDLDEELARRAVQLRTAAEARLKMLAVADPILTANVKAAAALEPAEKAWAAAVEAEKLTDQAVAQYNRLNKPGVTASKTLNTRAQTGFTRSRELFGLAEAAFPEATFEAYLAYVDGKLGLVKISLQSDNAYLAGNIVGANRLATSYNAEEQKVIALAKKLPDSPSRAIATAYESIAGSATATYFEARERATEADARLRE